SLRDPGASVERAEIKPAEAVPAVEREYADPWSDSQCDTAGHARIAAEADGELSNTGKLQPADGGRISKGRLKTIAPAIPNTLLRVESDGIERGDEIRSISEASAKITGQADSHFPPRARNDNGFDEGSLDSIERRRFVPLIDDTDWQKHHARSEIERRLYE